MKDQEVLLSWEVKRKRDAPLPREVTFKDKCDRLEEFSVCWCEMRESQCHT